MVERWTDLVDSGNVAGRSSLVHGPWQSDVFRSAPAPAPRAEGSFVVCPGGTDSPLRVIDSSRYIDGWAMPRTCCRSAFSRVSGASQCDDTRLGEVKITILDDRVYLKGETEASGEIDITRDMQPCM
jgi:hypothetical protein